MRKKLKIPTLLALLFLLLGVGGGVVLIKRGPDWFAGAGPEVLPKQVKVTNITDSSFTVSWVTDEATVGFLLYGPDAEPSLTATDDRDQLSGQPSSFLTHHITVKGLNPATNYLFRINSGSKSFDNNGQPYKISTAPTVPGPTPANDVAYGIVVDQSGAPAEGVIIYLSLANASPLSALSKASGSWLVPLSLARTTDLANWVAYDLEASTEEVFAQGGVGGTATAVAVTKYDSPLATITLGQSFDFRQPAPEPQAGLPTPIPTTADSGFALEEGDLSATLRVINPTQDEDLSNPRPEIFGTGPAGETLTIEVNSPQTYSDQITINEDGTWNWTPPADLPPGDHTLTVTLSSGKTVSRLFTVLAAEGSNNDPAFTASPSATLTPTTTPVGSGITPTLTPTSTLTPTPTSTGAGRTSLPSTGAGIPQPGNLTPTLLLSIMGIALISFALFSQTLFKKV